VGMKNGSIVECDIEKVKPAKETIMHSHDEGEEWALVVLHD